MRSSTNAMPSVAASEIATQGVLKRGWTLATRRRSIPSSAIAKKMRGVVISAPARAPKVESITVVATKTTPFEPITRSATAAATSRERLISSTDRTLRSAGLARL